MQYDHFKIQLSLTGLTAAAFARLMHMHKNTITNYAKAGRVPDHLAVIVVLLRELARAGVDYRAPLEEVEFHDKLKRGKAIVPAS